MRTIAFGWAGVMMACAGSGDVSDEIGRSGARVEVGPEREVDPPDPVPWYTVRTSAHRTLSAFAYDAQLLIQVAEDGARCRLLAHGTCTSWSTTPSPHGHRARRGGHRAKPKPLGAKSICS